MGSIGNLNKFPTGHVFLMLSLFCVPVSEDCTKLPKETRITTNDIRLATFFSGFELVLTSTLYSFLELLLLMIYSQLNGN